MAKKAKPRAERQRPQCENEEQRQELLDAYARDWAFNYIEFYGELIEEE